MLQVGHGCHLQSIFLDAIILFSTKHTFDRFLLSGYNNVLSFVDINYFIVLTQLIVNTPMSGSKYIPYFIETSIEANQ